MDHCIYPRIHSSSGSGGRDIFSGLHRQEIQKRNGEADFRPLYGLDQTEYTRRYDGGIHRGRISAVFYQ